MLLERRIVHEQIEFPEFLHGFANGTLAELRIFYITRDRDTSTPFRLDRRQRLFSVRLLLGKMNYRNVRAFACEKNRDRTAYTGIAAGNDRRLILQLA